MRATARLAAAAAIAGMIASAAPAQEVPVPDTSPVTETVAPPIADPVTVTAPAAQPKRSLAEKAAIAVGTVGAAVGAFAALKALLKPKAAAVPAPGDPAPTGTATPF